MKISRRSFINTSATFVGAAYLSRCAGHKQATTEVRRYHIFLTPETINQKHELIKTIANAGCDAVWTGGFFYGHWPYSVESIIKARKQIEAFGMEAHIGTVPLGHPGDSLGSSDDGFPLTPPKHWKTAQRPDGKIYTGTSLHDPATSENVQAIKTLRNAGFKQFFLDDDFRLARSPGEIGGCFCKEHRNEFLQLNGYNATQWQELLEDVQSRRFSPLLRSWVEFTADQLTESFRQQEQAAGGSGLGIMVMYFGAEKAGIRLSDYTHVPFRVGELMFDDKSFSRVKGKTDELYSVLFHRRFAKPELAWSETTAFPADKLSASNLAAKLVISTIADVRNTTFMSGVTPFPNSHWNTLTPAMRIQAQLHAQLAGHQLHGPLKHWWGEASRYVGKDRPFSLWLALGIPFQVCDRIPKDGWTFLSNEDAMDSSVLQDSASQTRFIARPDAANSPTIEPMDESLSNLFDFKSRLIPQLKDIPFVEQSVPAICAWYPTARKVLVWNLTEKLQTFSVRLNDSRRELQPSGLEAGLIKAIG